MIELRLYRAAFIPAVIAVVIVMFSLANRPPPLPPQLAADILFDGESAAEVADTLARRFPDRRAGAPGNETLAEQVAAELQARGFETAVDRFSDGDAQLTNVIGTRTGQLRDRIVVIAARDAAVPGQAGGSAADTAALLELARALEGRAPRKTIVLASVDGSTAGQAGIRRFVETAADSDRIRAVFVLSDLAARSGAPRVVAWSDDATRGSIGLERTVAAALRRDFPGTPESAPATDQLAHLAFPIAPGGQGPLLDAGLPAVRIAGGGELPPTPESLAQPNEDRLGKLGRATLEAISAVDLGGSPVHGPGAYVTIGRKVLPGWAVQALALTLLIPALIGSVDAFARARRRREPVARWLIWAGAACLAFATGLAFAMVTGLVGLAPAASPATPIPSADPVGPGPIALMIGSAAAVAGAWIGARPLLGLKGSADPSAPGAGCAIALCLTFATLALWVFNPFAALLMVPAAHAWTFALVGLPRARSRWRALLVLAGVVPALLVALHYLRELSLDPLEGAWYLFVLVVGGQVGLPIALLGCVFLGLLACTVASLAARIRGGGAGRMEDTPAAARNGAVPITAPGPPVAR